MHKIHSHFFSARRRRRERSKGFALLRCKSVSLRLHSQRKSGRTLLCNFYLIRLLSTTCPRSGVLTFCLHHISYFCILSPCAAFPIIWCDLIRFPPSPFGRGWRAFFVPVRVLRRKRIFGRGWNKGGHGAPGRAAGGGKFEQDNTAAGAAAQESRRGRRKQTVILFEKMESAIKGRYGWLTGAGWAKNAGSSGRRILKMSTFAMFFSTMVIEFPMWIC